jgi:hypothetical protein
MNKRTMTKRDTPAAKRSMPPPLSREEPIEGEVTLEEDNSPTIPIPMPWFVKHDELYGRS